MSHRFSWIVGSLLAGTLMATTGCAPVDPRSPATLRMVQRLAELTPGDDETAARDRTRDFLGNRPERIPQLRAQIEAALDPIKIYELHAALSMELLLDGQSEKALEVARKLGPQIDALADAAGWDRAGALRNSRLLRGLAAMRLGEQENCIANHGAHSCIFPIAGDGVHRLTRGSRSAIVDFSELLRDNPGDLAARWLLNVAYMTLGEYPAGVPPRLRIDPGAFESEVALPAFADRAVAAGVDAMGLAGGAIVEDFDGDGLLDIVTSSWGLADPLRYFRNAGDGTFRDRTLPSGLMGQVGGLNLSHADYDNDGRPDVLVLRGAWLSEGGRHPNSLLRNLGGGRFEDVTEQAGVYSLHPTQVAAWADFDNDGFLDLFVGNEQWTVEKPHASQMYRNDGDGTFTDCAFETSLGDLGPVKGAAWGDYDNDGRADLYVSRLGATNLLFHNAGPAEGHDYISAPCDWRFSEVSERAGVREPAFSFPTWFFDYDNDGWEDLFVAAWDGSPVENVAAYYLGMGVRGEVPRLFRNEGDGTFSDVTGEARLDRVLLTMGANYGDVDNDGYPDIYLGTGAPDLRTLVPNRLFRNDGGRTFQDATTAGGLGHLQKGHAIAFGDVDGDGDQDIYASIGGFFSGDAYQNVLFENPGGANHWITLRFEGTTSNRTGVGTRIALQLSTPEGSRTVRATVSTGGSFGSSSLQQEIGLGDALAIESVTVFWPASGERSVYRDVAMDRIFLIREGANQPVPVESKTLRLRTSAGGHRHPG